MGLVISLDKVRGREGWVSDIPGQGEREGGMDGVRASHCCPSSL